MKKLLSVLIATTLFMTAQSAVADSKGQAVTACKAEARLLMGDDTRVKMKKLRSTRAGYRLSLNVYPAEGERQSVKCEVEDGTAKLTDSDGMVLSTMTPEVPQAS